MMEKPSIYKILALVALGATGIGMPTDAQRFVVKPHVELGIGNSMSVHSNLPGLTKSIHTDEYGLELGYRFWQHGPHSLEGIAGAGYRQLPLAMEIDNLDYSYNAPADADMDGDTYIRCYELSGLRMERPIEQITVPIYLSYGYCVDGWLTLHADIGVKLGIKMKTPGLKVTGGEAFCYGIYPQYADLVIDEDYLNDFGYMNLDDAKLAGMGDMNKCSTSLLAGLGMEAKIWGPISLDFGVRYEYGFDNVYKSNFPLPATYTATTAPVTYTVAGGTVLKPFTEYVRDARVSRLSANLGLTFRF